MITTGVSTLTTTAAYGRSDTHLIVTPDNGLGHCIAYPGGAFRKYKPRFFLTLALAQAYLDKLV